MSNMPQRSSPLIVVCNMPVAWIGGYSWQWQRAGLTVCFPSNPLPLWGRVIVMCAGSLRHAQTLLLLKREIERGKIGDKVGWSGQFFVSHLQNCFCWIIAWVLNWMITVVISKFTSTFLCCCQFLLLSFDESQCSPQKGLLIKHHWVAPWLSQPKNQSWFSLESACSYPGQRKVNAT